MSGISVDYWKVKMWVRVELVIRVMCFIRGKSHIALSFFISVINDLTFLVKGIDRQTN